MRLNPLTLSMRHIYGAPPMPRPWLSWRMVPAAYSPGPVHPLAPVAERRGGDLGPDARVAVWV